MVFFIVLFQRTGSGGQQIVVVNGNHLSLTPTSAFNNQVRFYLFISKICKKNLLIVFYLLFIKLFIMFIL